MNARLQKFEGRLLSGAVTVAAVVAFLAFVFVFAAAAPVSAQTTPYGCELVLAPVWSSNATVPAGGELEVPAPPAGARIFCVDGLLESEAGAIELVSSTVFTATVGSSPVGLNIVGANLATAVPLNKVEQAYGVTLAPGSPVPSIKLVDDPEDGVGMADIRLFWGSAKTAAGRLAGQLGTWKVTEFDDGIATASFGYAEGRDREFRVRVNAPVQLLLSAGYNFSVEGLGVQPTCTRIGCTLVIHDWSGGSFTVRPSRGGWVSVDVNGTPGNNVEFWVPSGAPPATTTNSGNNKGGGGFPTHYLPTPLRLTP